jgi:DNA-binding XRE family transcriptional regulator
VTTTKKKRAGLLDVAGLGPRERRALFENIVAMVEARELTLGDAARLLRAGVLGLDRATFAKNVGISERSLASLEDDVDANPTLETLRRVFQPFGMALGLMFKQSAREPPTEAVEQQRAALRAALAKARRKRASS